MSGYLDRLKQLESSENFLNTPSIKPAKPPKAPFDGFGGSPYGYIENISVLDRSVNLKIVRQQKPIAPTGIDLHKEEELKRLVLLVSEHHSFSQEEHEEALTHALRDPVDALTCFTSLARQAELI